jgi:catechol 2,3-dioxygenase-like lactoylglutathione lyase family enzyme
MRFALVASVLLAACGTPGITPYPNCKTDNPPAIDLPSPTTDGRLVPELNVPDVDTGLAYYRDVLGFTVVRNDSAAHSCFAVVTYGSDGVILNHIKGSWKPFDNLELRILVADVDADYARMKAAGAAIVTELEDAEYGLRQFRVRDPYGTRLRFAKPIP